MKQQWHVVRVVSSITLRQVFWTRKTLGMLLLALLPILLVLMQRIFGHMSTRQVLRFFPEMLVFMYVMFIGMLYALFYGSAVVADEVENQTLTYLLSRPVKKQIILLSKYLAYLIGSVPVVLVSLLITLLIVYTQPQMSGHLGSALRQFPRYALLLAATLMSYGAVYLLFGVQFKRPVLYGLLFFGWEKIVLALSGILRKLSIIHYLLSILPDSYLSRDLRQLRAEAVPAHTAWIVIASITVAFVIGSVLIFSSREYRFTE